MNEKFRRKLLQPLRSLKHRIELGRLDRAFSSDLGVVLIFTYGKVGSTAIHTKISQLPGFASFQTHFISESGVADARKLHLKSDREPIHLKLGDRVRTNLSRHPEKQVRMITLVRDPVARAVSDLFENPEILISGGDLRTMQVEQVVEIAADHLRRSVDYTEGWFDRELSSILGVDFFSLPYDKETGFSITKEGRFSLLAGKLEMLSKNGPRYLGEFMGQDSDLEIPKRRARSETNEASLYQQVRERFRLPGDVLDEVYQSRVCGHFYSERELDEFRLRWQRV